MSESVKGKQIMAVLQVVDGGTPMSMALNRKPPLFIVHCLGSHSIAIFIP